MKMNNSTDSKICARGKTNLLYFFKYIMSDHYTNGIITDSAFAQKLR